MRAQSTPKKQIRDEDEDVESSPFGVADYVQLAGMSRRSVILEVQGLVAGRGTIYIEAGSLWSARDERGAGIAAFRRLVFLSDAVVRCLPFDEHEVREPRTLDISCESALLDAARIHDEMRAPRRLLSSRPPARAAAVDGSWDTLPSMRPPAVSTVQRVSSVPPLNNVTSITREPLPPPRGFAELYDEGVEHLLRRRFADAYRAFCAADAARPGDSLVRANLVRLEQMGYKP